MNITDEDGDTPLYVVENVETARYLVERGAEIHHRNHEGITVCCTLYEPANMPLDALRSLLVA